MKNSRGNIAHLVIVKLVTHTLREKCPNAELFLVRISSGKIPKIPKYPKNSVFGHFLRSDTLQNRL